MGKPIPKILALLIDGRWSPALTELETALQQGQDLSRLLQDASGQIGQRTQAALKVAPNQAEVQAWIMLLVGHRHDRAAAIAWLRQHLKQTGVAETAVATNAVLQRTLDVLNTLPLPATHPPRLVGMVEAIDQPDLRQWERLTPTATPETENQQWYRVRVALFHDGQQWRRSPSPLNLPSIDRGFYLWQLVGLTHTPQLQLLTWTAIANPNCLMPR
ncbi:MAG: hypothetical protein HC881_07790 [Leptolyngbyaceae cyanobacterium SL_7_1]|nr:hypothetical protein [Leptolyngbyaceae cyanobacterium SL_7_1]